MSQPTDPFDAARVAAFCDNIPDFGPLLIVPAPRGWEEVEAGHERPAIGERIEWQTGPTFHSGVLVAFHQDGRLIIDRGEGRLCYRHPNAPRFTF